MASTTAASSDAPSHCHHVEGGGGAHGHTPAPPPPTPSNHVAARSLSVDADAALSRFLQFRITPSLPSSFSKHPRLSPIPSPSSSDPPPHPSPPPLISLLEHRPDLLSAAADLGLFHLADHGLPSHLPASALLESQSLLHSPTIATAHPSPLGFNHEDDADDDESDDKDPIFVFETDQDGLESFPSLVEYAKGLERVGLEVVEMLSSIAGGFPESPFRERRARGVMWVSVCSSSGEGEERVEAGMMKRSKCYPYVIGLQYEMKDWREPSWVIGDSGEWIPVEPCADSILVTLGDIAQVWSNGRFKKVMGRPQHASLPTDGTNDSGCISLSLLVTLPLDSVISPLLPLAKDDCDQSIADAGDGCRDNGARRFRAFALEEYAWRIYHERFPFKDPLLRYRI